MTLPLRGVDDGMTRAASAGQAAIAHHPQTLAVFQALPRWGRVGVPAMQRMA